MNVITVGKSASCDIVIDNQYVSRVHGEISIVNNHYMYRDTSKNGTVVNGRPVNNREVEVNPNDRILLANQVQLPWSQVYQLLPLNQGGNNPQVSDYNPPANNYNPAPQKPGDGPSVLGIILGFLFPIVGLILYLVWKPDYPRKAKSAGVAALVSMGIVLLYYIFAIALIASL